MMMMVGLEDFLDDFDCSWLFSETAEPMPIKISTNVELSLYLPSNLMLHSSSACSRAHHPTLVRSFTARGRSHATTSLQAAALRSQV